MSRGRGGGKTPQCIIDLVNEEVERTSQIATARAIGLTTQTVQRYMKGVGEPSNEIMQRIANYFNETFVIEIKPQKEGGK